MKLGNLAVIALFLSFSGLSEGKTFQNAYLAFELPDGWNCGLESTEWICRNQDQKTAKEAIIIFTAKEQGPTDKFEIYEAHINTSRELVDKTGRKVNSTISIKAAQKKYNDHFWVDGLQKGSEIPNYFTRYVATIKDQIAILVTFSAHAEHYAKYSTDFFRAIQTLRVKATKNLLSKNSEITSSPNTTGVWGASSTAPGGTSMDPGPAIGSGRTKKSNQLTYILLGLGALLVAAGLFFMGKTKKH